MTESQQLAQFVQDADLARISPEAVEQLKIRVLDTLGVAISALDAEPTVAIRELLTDLGGTPTATMIGGGKTSPERAAFYNSALSRYLDFMDAYLAKGETNHPSDNFGAVLSSAESVDASGAELLTAFAVAYQVQTRLSDVAPVRDKGFDHTTQGAFAAAAAAAKALRLPAEQIANAIAMAGTANVALRVTRTGNLSHWKGLAYPHVSKEGTFAALLASRGITGPEEVFEGNKGFKDSIAGDFEIDWSQEDLESVTRTIIKKHNAEIHSQSALDAAQEIRDKEGFDPDEIDKVHLTTFDVAYSIIGGGEEGDKQLIRTKEEADHSLPWMLAVVFLDGHLNPEQYAPERITADDVQALMKKVEITPSDELSKRFPEHMPAELQVTLSDGTEFSTSKDSYSGFHDDPLSWEQAREKFDVLVTPFTGDKLRDEIAEIVHDLDNRQVSELTEALSKVSVSRG
ncbi:MmgE/PrpD family protein [Corynebacterium ammoniagenes]|uniref:2-methylcitrate dehydratase n=2 Tax=Corynebacterium ammoniagenes TaxID=1697 RepID=A0AAV5GBD6_CORAM|nr:MmgE/PrpD family protein [Corynebacterium ammoniagenes]APT83345.1 2-methylcitrate dehydratase [Corynebacterium ammoniagenes DSM 20306]AQS74359.1 2-methylcitrate dehydratase [Corynebacterium ammoniagenes]EFG81406.1 MmgE/PrpD family protein [Corynebacterium ammoniagenes DSM 20306]GJN43973.1 2-methylcitrate dehydratase [Corynebacterium ammoniagenes]